MIRLPPNLEISLIITSHPIIRIDDYMSNWIDTLKNVGAELNTDNTELAISNTDDTCIVPLLHQSLLCVDGPDTDKFLQGQLSCDVDSARTLGSSLASHCNIKGHMISLFRLIATETGFLLRMHHELLEQATKTLSKYIIFSKAEISYPGDRLVGIGLTGPKAAELSRLAVEDIPSEDNGITHGDNTLLIRVPGNRFELWLPESVAIELLPTLLEHGKLGSTNDWILSEIRAGIPDLRTQTTEAFIPQMTNLQALDGVSFTKGCYTGQEIVTRLQHRGQLKRPMYHLTANSPQLPEPGSAIHSSTRENVGQVVIAAQSSGDSCEFLAVIIKDVAENDTLHLERSSGPVVGILELPYTLDPNLFVSKKKL